MSNGPDALQPIIASIPLTAPGFRASCDIPGADGARCPSSVEAVGSIDALRTKVAARGWRVIVRDGDSLDVCPAHPDEQ